MTAQSSASAPSASRRRLNRLAARFARAQGGATAVEFALIALPFFAMLFGILELAMLFILSTSLDNATSTTARKIRTGTVHTASEGAPMTSQAFKDDICKNLGWLTADCDANLYVEVRGFNTFSEVVLTDPVKSDKTMSTLPYTTGAAGQIMLVRVYYSWTLISPLLSKAVDRVEGGKALVSSTMTFRNEPYS